MTINEHLKNIELAMYGKSGYANEMKLISAAAALQADMMDDSMAVSVSDFDGISSEMLKAMINGLLIVVASVCSHGN